MPFPHTRHRRLRLNPQIRALVRETRLGAQDLIQPLFLVPGERKKSPIASLPGQFHFSPDSVVEEAAQIKRAGIPGVLLFGIPEKKDASGSSAIAADGIVQRGILAIKRDIKDLLVVADLCFCEYTDHGHCGVVVDGEVDNDRTLVELGDQAVSLAKAGADIIAPSGMMDGMVGAIRSRLDESGFQNVLIMSYAAKYASAFYGPFRDAVQSAPGFGDRKGYQMDPSNKDEALREVATDIEEGADIVMVKPALAYLDIIAAVKENYSIPLAAYNVSGEYSMIKAAAEKGWIDEQQVMMESLISMKRAGADIIITYFAKDAAALL